MHFSFIKRAVKTVLSLFLFLSAAPFLSGAVLSGNVNDALNQQALADVIITVKGTSIVVFTDALGHYKLNGLQAGKAVLKFSRMGYITLTDSAELKDGPENFLNEQMSVAAVRLNEVTISNQKNIGESMSTINQVDMALRPTNSAQDLMRLVPGLFIAQHAGGGKAEQIFLRGFDADHGTDFSVNIDGMPVNMVSHAHGQGYADFHFVIPETVDALRVSKGPYSAKYGDFATSGAGEFSTKNAIASNEVKLEYGMFDTYRALLMLKTPDNKNLFKGKNDNGYIAGEYFFSNSYFESKQHFNRYNVFGKYSIDLNSRNSLSFSASTFSSYWDASGQVPERAIEEGLITRFGSIDNSEGGSTSRTNLNAILTSGTAGGGVFKNQFFYSYYKFNLYSDFTFFLNDSIHGDEINQTEHGRNIFGYKGTYEKYTTLFGKELKSAAGIGTRIDKGETSLKHTYKREYLNTIMDGELYEQNVYAYLDETLKLSDKFSVNAAARLDHFIFGYDNFLSDTASGQKTKHRVSPKLSFYYTPNPSLQFYVRSGIGFHSNDARSVVSGQSGNSLPRAFGYEAGSTFKAGKNILVNIALWGLDLENELVYVGDEGVVEISDATRRLGADLSLRAELVKNVFADMDLNYTYGRYPGLPKGENYIALAPSLTSTGGITLKQENGFSASLRYRYIASRPANEDNSVQAKGYFLLDAVVSYHLKHLEFGLSAQNLLNSKWNEAQFDTESRLQNETMPVSELHFTPGTPFFLKGSVTVFF